MSNLKWFSGGSEREQEAISIIAELLADLENDETSVPLQKLLSSYESELEKSITSVPLVLSRMNLQISSVLRNNGIILGDYQSRKMKKLRSLSNIRF